MGLFSKKNTLCHRVLTTLKDSTHHKEFIKKLEFNDDDAAKKILQTITKIKNSGSLEQGADVWAPIIIGLYSSNENLRMTAEETLEILCEQHQKKVGESTLLGDLFALNILVVAKMPKLMPYLHAFKETLEIVRRGN